MPATPYNLGTVAKAGLHDRYRTTAGTGHSYRRQLQRDHTTRQRGGNVVRDAGYHEPAGEEPQLPLFLNQPQVSWQPQRSFDVVIAPDGSFQVQSGPAYIRGQVSQGHMQGQIVGDVCSYQFEADNSGTW